MQARFPGLHGCRELSMLIPQQHLQSKFSRSGRLLAKKASCAVLTQMRGQRTEKNSRLLRLAALDSTRQERNDDRIAAQDLHELGFLTGIFDGHRGQGSHPVPELSYKHNNVYLAGGSCAEFAARPSGPEGPENYENLHTQAGQQMLH